LKKDNLLSSDPAMQLAISRVFGPDAAPASEGIIAKLEHRLLSSKALSREVIMVISSLSSPLKPRQDNGNDAGEESGRPLSLQRAKRPSVNKSNTEQSTMDRRTPSETGSVSVPIIIAEVCRILTIAIRFSRPYLIRNWETPVTRGTIRVIVASRLVMTLFSPGPLFYPLGLIPLLTVQVILHCVPMKPQKAWEPNLPSYLHFQMASSLVVQTPIGVMERQW
jgi:hypothetical protein